MDELPDQHRLTSNLGPNHYGDPQQSLIAHQHSDLDTGPEAQHHSLGMGAEQAAPGNHVHRNLVDSLPAASANYRGLIYVVKCVPATSPDAAYICLLNLAGTGYSWKALASG